MSIASLLQKAAAIQVKFANREDSELQLLKAEAWEAVALQIEALIDRKLEELTAPPKKIKRG